MGFQLGFAGGCEVYRRVSAMIFVNRAREVGIYRGDLPCRISGLWALEFRNQSCFVLFLWAMVSSLMAKDRISAEFPGLLESLKVECIKT